MKNKATRKEKNFFQNLNFSNYKSIKIFVTKNLDTKIQCLIDQNNDYTDLIENRARVTVDITLVYSIQ